MLTYCFAIEGVLEHLRRCTTNMLSGTEVRSGESCGLTAATEMKEIAACSFTKAWAHPTHIDICTTAYDS